MNLDEILEDIKAGKLNSLSFETISKYSKDYLNRKLIKHQIYYKKKITPWGDDPKVEFEHLKELNRIDPNHIAKPYAIVRDKYKSHGYMMEYVKDKPLIYYINMFQIGKLKLSDYQGIYMILNDLINVTFNMHRNGVYHGDIHDENIIVDMKNLTFKLIDPLNSRDGRDPKIDDLKSIEFIIRSFYDPNKLFLYKSDEYKRVMENIGQLFNKLVTSYVVVYK